jgi:hypothetical protein
VSDAVVVFVEHASGEPDRLSLEALSLGRAIARVSERLGGGPPQERDGLVVVPKVAPTPAGFPRRVGVAKKRPLA